MARIVDIHPQQSGYNELRDTYLNEARAAEDVGSIGDSAWAGQLLLVFLLELKLSTATINRRMRESTFCPGG